MHEPDRPHTSLGRYCSSPSSYVYRLCWRGIPRQLIYVSAHVQRLLRNLVTVYHTPLASISARHGSANPPSQTNVYMEMGHRLKIRLRDWRGQRRFAIKRHVDGHFLDQGHPGSPTNYEEAQGCMKCSTVGSSADADHAFAILCLA